MDSRVMLIVDGEGTIKALDEKRKNLFFATQLAITPAEQASVDKLYNLIFAQDEKGLKKRAQGILRKIFHHSRELFVLCGLAATFTSIANQIKTDAGVERLLAWYDKVEHPPALKKIEEALLPREPLSRNDSIQQDPKSTLTVDSQNRSPSRIDTIQHTLTFDSKPNKKRARTSTGLAANSVDIQSLQEYRTIVQLLYPTQDIESLRSLSREQLISLLDSSRQDPPSHALSPNCSNGSQSSASSPEEDQKAELSYQYPSGEPIDTTTQTSKLTSNPSNSVSKATSDSSITFLSETFPNILPHHEDSVVLQNNDYVLPHSGVSNLQRKDIFTFFAQYKGGCAVTIQNGEPYSIIDLWYQGLAEFGVRISVRKEILDALLVTLGRSSAVGTRNIISDISSEDVLYFLQAGPDPGPTMQLVTTWTSSTYLPSITIPQGHIMIRPSIKGDLIAYVKEKGVVLEYWENKELNIGNTVPSDGAGYIPP